MNKNLIILIIIVLGWFLVIRPLSAKKTSTSKTSEKDVKLDKEEDAESAGESEDTEEEYTAYPNSEYVDVSKGFGTVDGIGVDWDALIKKYGTRKTYTN